MNALVLGEKTLKGPLSLSLLPLPSNPLILTGVICYKNNHKPAIDSLASGRITLEGPSSLASLVSSLMGLGQGSSRPRFRSRMSSRRDFMS